MSDFNRKKRGPKKRAFYTAHVEFEELKETLQGTLKVSARRRKVGYVNVEGVLVDVFIADERDRNRAIVGDVVALELYPEDRWVEMGNGAEKAEGGADGAVAMFDADQIASNEATQRSLWMPRDAIIAAAAGKEKGTGADISSSTSSSSSSSSSLSSMGPTLHALDMASRACGKQPTGRVIAITKRLRKATGHIGRLEPLCTVWDGSGPLPSDEAYVYFVPSDMRYPTMIIPRLQLPDAFIANPYEGIGQIFICDFQPEWPEASKMPLGCNVRSLGEVGNIAAETEALLAANNCNHLQFSEECMAPLQDFLGSIDGGEELKGLGGSSNWQIPEAEIAKRRDFRNVRICTIDPPNAKDLDDALHICPVEGETDVFEVGVHIADVSYFLAEDTALDREALTRATSVYLVQKVIPMLPPLLCEQLCSLNPNVDRLAFSCVWKMRGDGTLVDEKPWFGRSVIRSCAKLDYPTAQRMIDGDIPSVPDSGANADAFLTGLPEHVWEAKRRPIGQAAWALCKDVRMLHRCAMGRRQKRLASGALVLHRSKLTFVRDAQGNPVDTGTYTLRESNQLVEEYMLLANYLVAQELLSEVGPAAFIRHHPPPKEKGMEDLQALARHIGMPIDVSSAAALQESLNRISRSADARCTHAVSCLLMQPMNVASYEAAGKLNSEAWRHYALAIPYYTHFTSPIRRYADVMVHRLLDVVVSRPQDKDRQKESDNVDRLARIATQCNEMKAASKVAQERSDAVFFAVYIRDHPEETFGTIIGLGEKSFTILVDKYGIEARVYTDEMKDVHGTFDAGKHELVLTKALHPEGREPKFDHACRLKPTAMTIGLMGSVVIRLEYKAEAPIDVRVLLVGPRV